MASALLPASCRGRYVAIVLLASLVALGLHSYATAPGLAGTADTYHYLSAAHSLKYTGRLLLADGSSYQWWPPLYAVVLRYTGVGASLHLLNGLALLGALLAWSGVGYWLLPLLLALGTPALVMSKFIWSEIVFMWLWASYFLVLLAWLRRGGAGLGLLATALGCLLPLQRIAGLFLLAGVGAGLAWPGTRQLVRPGRWAQLGHLAGAASGLVIWQLMYWAGAGLGAPLQPRGDFMTVAAEYGFVLSRWLVPLPAASSGLLPIAWVFILISLLISIYPKEINFEQLIAPVAARALPGARMLFAGLVSTLILLIVASMRGRVNHDVYEAERYLAALYPPVVLLVLLAWPSGPCWAARWGPLLLAAWVLYQGVRVTHNAWQLRQLLPADTSVFTRPSQ